MLSQHRSQVRHTRGLTDENAKNPTSDRSVAVTGIACSFPAAFAREINGGRFQVTESVDSVELISGTSRRLKFDYKVPELMIENPEVISATPVAPNEILISGIKPGVSTITISDANKNLQTIRIHVTVDTRQLEMAFQTHFPDSNIKVHALQTGVLLGGNVARADQVSNIMSVAKDFFPTGVVNQMQVNGSQNIAIKVKIYEVARDKLRAVGVDWSLVGEDFNIISSVSQLISNVGGAVTSSDANVTASVVSDTTRLNAAVQFLEARSIARLLDEPVLVAQNGRPAEFLSGGELPIPLASGLGAVNVEFRAFGTKLDIVPLVHGQGLMTLEVRAEVSEIAQELAVAGIPGLRIRRVNTGVKMRAGHTLALAGDYADRTDNSVQGVPKLMDNPVFGPLFRKSSSRTRENELVFLITPQFVNDIDASYVDGQNRPGNTSANPSDRELFINGHVEVPKCNDDCPVGSSFTNGPAAAGGYNQQPMATMPQAATPQIAPRQVNQYSQAQQQPTANTDFESSFNFPSNGSSRRASESVADAEGSGFLWPTNSRTR